MRHHKANIVVKYRGAKRVDVSGRAVRLLDPKECQAMVYHVVQVREVRISQGEAPMPMKLCRGCAQSFPRIRAYFNCRERKGHKPYWYPYCRTCKRELRDRKRVQKVAP